MDMRSWHLFALGLLVVLAAGCGAADEPGEGAVPKSSDPLALVGQWHVDLPAQGEVAAVSLGERLVLFAECGVMDGSWRADGQQGLFVAHVFGGDGECFTPDGPPDLTWLESAQRFAVDGETAELLDSSGAPVAVLRAGARPTVGPNRSQEYYEAPPTVTPQLRARTEEPAALPPEAEAPTSEQLVGRWVPTEVPRDSEAHLAFGADGDWRGSDGCNGLNGRYVLGDGGRVLATDGPSTLVGCDGAPVGLWLSQAARAGLIDEQLVLYDAAGRQLAAFLGNGD